MATRYYETSVEIFKTNRTATLTNLYNCFHQFDDRFTMESGTDYLVFNNMVKIDMIAAASSTNTPTWQYLNPLNTVVVSSGGINITGNYLVRIIITEHCFICKSNNGSGYQFMMFFYIKNNSTAYISFVNSNTNIDAITNIYRMNTDGVGDVSGFGFQKICNVQLVSPYVLFSTTNVITTSGNGNFAVLDDFRSCSVVSPFSTVTINNKNYMAIGTNTLVEAPAT